MSKSSMFGDRNYNLSLRKIEKSQNSLEMMKMASVLIPLEFSLRMEPNKNINSFGFWTKNQRISKQVEKF